MSTANSLIIAAIMCGCFLLVFGVVPVTPPTVRCAALVQSTGNVTEPPAQRSTDTVPPAVVAPLLTSGAALAKAGSASLAVPRAPDRAPPVAAPDRAPPVAAPDQLRSLPLFDPATESTAGTLFAS